ncbi:MAG: hypothetical protein K9J48_04210, partial [Desulfohalobiaceae bacterium]|nr:hypothetical protein [Desulfohalobiaceae bacterium]
FLGHPTSISETFSLYNLKFRGVIKTLRKGNYKTPSIMGLRSPPGSAATYSFFLSYTAPLRRCASRSFSAVQAKNLFLQNH